jgi:hypothetical protein
MWCEHCRQNVAGMLSETQDSVRCSRCGTVLPGEVPRQPDDRSESAPPLPCPGIDEGAATPVAHAPGSPPCAALPRSSLESWDLDEELRHIERLLRRDGPRIDNPAWHTEPNRTRARARAPSRQAASDSTRWFTALRSALAWLLICAGLAATVCGVVLLAWWWFGARADLLIPGLACAAGGQFGLLGGLLIQPAQASIPAETEHPAGQWLEVHRHIDDILRADLPGRGSPDAP